jgi:hypothetical protein
VFERLILRYPAGDADPHGINYPVLILAGCDSDDPRPRVPGEDLAREPYPVIPVEIDLEQHHIDLKFRDCPLRLLSRPEFYHDHGL